MGRQRLSRRDFLNIMSQLGIVTVFGKLARFFPEFGWVKGVTQAKTLLNIPKDLVLEPIRKQKASRLISEALENEDARMLQRALPSFKPIIGEARVTSAVWSKGDQQAIVVGIPFRSAQGTEAALTYINTKGMPQSVMVEFTDQTDLSKGKIYYIDGDQVTVVDANPEGIFSKTSSGASCTTSCLIQCLPLWGCSGLALTLCIAAILSCPFFIGSCVAAWACTLYCGGAFSYCWCWCCGC